MADDLASVEEGALQPDPHWLFPASRPARQQCKGPLRHPPCIYLQWSN